MHKKGSLELSINAIVIVILAMTLLGLGLGFVRNMFSGITHTTDQVQDQMAEQILDDLRRGDKKLSFPAQKIDLEGGQEEIIAIGVKNTDPAELDFEIMLFEIVKDPDTNISDGNDVLSDPSLSTGDRKYAYFWDDTGQILSPGESNVYGITLKADKSATGTKLFKIVIFDTNVGPTEEYVEYASKTFFVKFI